MSIFSKKDYERENKANKRSNPRRASHGGTKSGIAPKVKLPTQNKTKYCSLCDNVAVKVVHVSGETRKLCRDHLFHYNHKDVDHVSVYQKASKLDD